MPPQHVLLLGGHGAISQLLTPKLLSASYRLTSLIRSESQTSTILSLGTAHPSNLNVDVSSLESITSDSAASSILQRINPDIVIWSAGAGGKGGPSRTNAIDRDACIHFIRAAAASGHVKKFLLVSHLGSRRGKPAWWDEEEWKGVRKFNEEVAPAYYKAKLAADEVLTVEGLKREGWGWICLRPGLLTDGKETGRVQLGRTKARGSVTRGDVAEVVVRLLEKDGVSGWFDLLGGDDGVGEAVERVLKEGVDSIEGEDVEAMKEKLGNYE